MGSISMMWIWRSIAVVTPMRGWEQEEMDSTTIMGLIVKTRMCLTMETGIKTETISSKMKGMICLEENMRWDYINHWRFEDQSGWLICMKICLFNLLVLLVCCFSPYRCMSYYIVGRSEIYMGFWFEFVLKLMLSKLYITSSPSFSYFIILFVPLEMLFLCHIICHFIIEF